MALYTMKEILADAQAKNYGVGFFNTFNMDMVQAVIGAAEECNSPVIIGPAEALLKFNAYEWIMPVMIDQARKAKVPVAVHLDHGYSFDVIGDAECIITKKMFTENGSILSDIYNVANQVACLNGTYEGYRID